MFEIKQGAPSWFTNKGKAGPEAKYPFREMEVGTTFVVPKDQQTCLLSSFRVLTSTKSRELGKKFHCKLTADGSFEVYRSA